jgi:DNA-binding NtrC family response regulator
MSLKVRILVVDDERLLLDALVDALEMKGYEVVGENCPEKALELIRSWQPDAAIFDYKMPKMNGVELAKQMLEILPDLPILLLSGYGTIRRAVHAIREGVYDYLAKPFDISEIETILARALDQKHQRQQYLQLAEAVGQVCVHEGIVGRGAAIQGVLKAVNAVADTDSIVSITGETGTGKELIAKAIHAAGGRKEKPFITVDCAAIPENLIESELFGHSKGSFTGAYKDKPGKVEVASDGTIFLDEIGELPLSLQKKFLRLLQEKTFTRVGEARHRDCEARIVTATNRCLASEVENKTFREDLYYRLKVIEIKAPPLSERLEDVPDLVSHYIPLLNKRLNRKVSGISPRVMTLLQSYSWPGNIRELVNTFEQVMTFNDCKVLDIDHFPESMRSIVAPNLPAGTYSEYKERILEDAGLAYFRALLIHFHGNVTRVSTHAKVDRRHLHRLIQKWGLEVSHYRNR